jgi:hypothetical protein
VIPWVRLGPRAEIAKLKSPIATALDAAYEKNREIIDHADLVAVVFAGAPVARTFFNRQTGALKYRDRDVPFYVIEDAASTADLAPPVEAVFRALGHAVPPGDRQWCCAGRTNLAPNAYRPGPTFPCAWCRERLGWVAPAFVTDGGSFALAPSAAFPGQVVKLPVNENEYYLIENRATWEFDRGIPREGLVIWHVTPAGDKCTNCFDRGILDVWHVHDPKAPPQRAQAYVPFLTLLKGLSLRVTRYEISGIQPDDRGDMFFEVTVP